MKKNKNIKRIFAALLAFSTTTVSLAANEDYYNVAYPWMDDVYRLDIQTMYGEVGSEEDDANTTEATLCMMGIMSRDDKGRFNPDSKLTRADYEAAIRAIYSGEAVDFKYYNTAYEGQKVYQKEIAAKLLSFVESVEIDENSIDVEQYARSAGILNGVTYNAGKEMTRRDFAVVVWNTLNCGYVTFTYGDGGFNITVDDDKTILKDKLGVYEIKGTLNAIFGLNIYSTVAPNAGYIEVNREKYNAYGIDGVENLLGYNVEGYAKYDEAAEEYKILTIAKAKKDETVSINLRDYEKMDETYLYYSLDDKYKKVKINSLKHIMYNGDFTNVITEDMLDGNGTLLIGKSTVNGEYDIAFIKEYQSFYTKRYLAEDMQLYLSYNAKFKGQYYIDLENDDANIIYTLDGVEKDISELTQNLSVNVIQNNTKTYTEIIASKNNITGSVTSQDEEKIIIGGEEFTIDPYYDELSESTSSGAANISIGSTGKFYYTSDNVIVSFEPEGSAKFGLLRKAWFDDTEEKAYVKLFTQSGEWIIYETIEKTEVDGTKAEGEQIIEKLRYALGENNKKSPTPIRYILKDDKVKFIDTLYDAPEEENDQERMQECGTFSGKTQWVKGWDMGSNDAHVGDATPMFVVPSNPDREQDYGISSGSAIPASQTGVTFTAYNPDKYLCARLAILYGGNTDTTDGWNFLYIKGLTSIYDEEEDEVKEGVNCYLLTRGKEEIDEKFYELPDDWQQRFGIDDLEACFVGAKFNGNEISQLSVGEGPYVKNNKIISDKGDSFFTRISTSPDWVAGTVIDVDVSRNYMLVDTGDDGIKSVVFAVFVIAKTDAKDPKHKAEGISVSEINPGDKIFYWGSLRRAYCCLIIDNYESAE